jgi:hypothetical protein
MKTWIQEQGLGSSLDNTVLLIRRIAKYASRFAAFHTKGGRGA